MAREGSETAAQREGSLWQDKPVRTHTHTHIFFTQMLDDLAHHAAGPAAARHPPPPAAAHRAAPRRPPRRHCRHPAAPEQPRQQTSHKFSALRAAAAGSPQASTALLEPSRRQSHLLRRRWGHGSRRPVLGGRHQLLLVTTIVSVDASAAPARRPRAPTPPSCSHSHGHRTSRLAD